MTRGTQGVLLSALLLCVGCTKKTSFRGPAYQHEEHAYAVAYDDAARMQILGDEWILDNYRRVPATTPDKPDTLVRKDAREYMTQYSFDLDDDGRFEDKIQRPSYDLLFKSRKTNAQIWLLTIPLSRELADKELRVLLSNYVESISSSGYVVLDLGSAVSGTRFSARMVEKADVTLSGKPALAATVEVANIDQMKLAPDARREKVRIVLSRPDFAVVRGKAGDAGRPEGRVAFRVLMVAGYSNDPEDFEAQYPEFQKFLSKIHLLKHSQAMDLLQPSLQECAVVGDKPADVVLAIDEFNAVKLEEQTNLTDECAKKAIAQQPFPFIGKARHVERHYDWSKPAPADWLSKPTYREPDRVPAAVAPAGEPAAASASEATPATEVD